MRKDIGVDIKDLWFTEHCPAAHKSRREMHRNTKWNVWFERASGITLLFHYSGFIL